MPEWIPVEAENHLQWYIAVCSENRVALAMRTPTVFNHLKKIVLLLPTKMHGEK